MAAGKGYDHVVSTGLEYPRGGIQMMVQDPEDNGIWHDQLANSSLPYCMHAAIVLLEEKKMLQKSNKFAGHEGK